MGCRLPRCGPRLETHGNRVVKNMPSAKLTAVHDELTAAQTVILPQIEGLHDFARLNLQPDTLTVVQAATIDFERRRDLIAAALAALDALSTDGYPEVPEREVIGAVYADLKDNVTTIEAAFTKFESIGPAVSAAITADVPTEQS